MLSRALEKHTKKRKRVDNDEHSVKKTALSPIELQPEATKSEVKRRVSEPIFTEESIRSGLRQWLCQELVLKFPIQLRLGRPKLQRSD